MRVLDLCCGLGGFSAGFKAAGCEVITVDIDSRVRPSLCADVRELSFNAGSFDVVLAAPPCTEYSRVGFRGLKGPAPDPDLSLWQACCRIAHEIEPAVFMLENVRSAIPFMALQTCAAAPGFSGDGFRQ